MSSRRVFPATRPATYGCRLAFDARYLGLGKYERDCSETCRQVRIFAARKGARLWRPGEQDSIIAAYRSGESVKSLAQLHGFGMGRISRLLRDRGVVRRPETASKKYPWDATMLAQPTSAAAYFAGLLMADGNLLISPRSAKLSITLQHGDGDLIRALCAFLRAPQEAVQTYTATVGNPPRAGRYTRLTLSDPRLPQLLRLYGIIPRKSYEFIAPDVDETRLPAFLRGWFDGDGSLRRGSANSSPRFTVCGHPEAMAWYRRALQQLGYTGGAALELRPDFSVVLTIAGRRQVAQVRALLSRDDGPRLERKWEDFVPVRRLTSTTEMGAILGVSGRTVMVWADEGHIPSERAGRNRLVDPAEVLEHLGLSENDLQRRAGRREVAAALGLTPHQVDGLRRRGVLPATTLPGLTGSWHRFSIVECRAALEG